MALGWFMILWSVCSILDAAIASDSQKFDMSLLQRAGGLLGYVLGCPLAWGLSKGFSIAIFVVVIRVFVAVITHTRVTQITGTRRRLWRPSLLERLKTVMTLTMRPNSFRTKSALGVRHSPSPKAFPPTTAPMRMEKTTIGRASLRV